MPLCTMRGNHHIVIRMNISLLERLKFFIMTTNCVLSMFHFFSRFETIWKSLASLAGRFLGFLQQQQKQHKKSTEKDSREKHHTQNEKRAPTNFCSLILSCTAAGVYCKARCRRARYCHGQKPAAKPYEECKAKALRSNAVRCDQKATGDLRVLIFQVGLPQMMCLPSLKSEPFLLTRDAAKVQKTLASSMDRMSCFVLVSG